MIKYILLLLTSFAGSAVIAQTAPIIPSPPAHIMITEEPIVGASDLDVKAQYEGGSEGLATFIAHNLQHLITKEGMPLKGTAYVDFVIDADGNTSHQKIRTASGYEELDNEAIRVVKLLHFKSAAIKDGKPVRSKYVIPIEF